MEDSGADGPSNYLEEETSWPESYWRFNYPSLREHTERVKKVLEDQTSRGQLIKLPDAEAKARYPNLVIASLGANRKDKPVSLPLLVTRVFGSRQTVSIPRRRQRPHMAHGGG